MISGTGMAVSPKTSGMEMEQRMRVVLVRKAVQEEEALWMMGVGWVMKVFLQVEVQGVEGVLWDGDELLLAEVQECASLLLVCRCTVGRQSEETSSGGSTKHNPEPTNNVFHHFYCLLFCFVLPGEQITAHSNLPAVKSHMRPILCGHKILQLVF